jgi:hypothetical protein
MAKGDPITWRFEVQRRDGAEWIPLVGELLGDSDLWDDHLGTHDLPECWDDPLEFASNELNKVLASLALECRQLGMSRARIVLWASATTEGDPAVVIQATDEQMAIGRLRAGADEVRDALRSVESARMRLRNQVIAEVGLLGRNQIARQVEGAWARRLILQFLAGYDIIRSVLSVLPRDWLAPSPRKYEPASEEEEVASEEYLAPYCHGPVCMSLGTTGQVTLSLIDVDRSEDPRLLDPWADGDEVEDYERAAEARALRWAEKIIPLLHKTGFHLTTAEGKEARVPDLAATWPHGSLVISKAEAQSRYPDNLEPG